MHQTLLLSVLLSQFCSSLSENHVYHLINKTKSWSEAQQYCRKYYTDLATVNDMTDQERLTEVAEGNEVWIGLNQTSDKPIDRKWHWSQPGVKYNKSDQGWKGNEPSDKGTQAAQAAQENCVVVDDRVRWIDTQCQPQRRCCFICYNETYNTIHVIKSGKEKRNWLAAQHYCRKHHTDLISGLDQLNMYNKTEQDKPRNKWCVIGLSRDNWGWSDGSDSSFRNWKTHVNPSDKKCAKLENDGGWDSDDCHKDKPFICYDERFILVKENKTWEDAMDYCRHHHRDLAWFNAPNLQRMVQKRAKMADSEVVWVGLHYTCFLEEWLWVIGHYVPGDDPNWKHPGYNDCGVNGAMERGGSNMWVKRPSEEKHNFICAKHC